MAIIRNAANTLKKGRVGETTYYISKGQQVARQSRNDSNYGESARRTIGQQERRVMWANLVEFYKVSARWMPKAFETKSVGQTDYNKFMAINVPSARIPLTKSQAEAGACVIDGFVISQGSLPSIEITQMTNSWKTNLLIGSLQIGAATTVGEISLALINNNANCREGMQLSFASYQQTVDPLGTPRVNCRLYEFTLSSTDSSLVRDHIPALGCSTVDGAIGTSEDVPLGGFAWILSELQNGTLKVSTQLLTVNNATLIAQYIAEQQLTAAINSYGLDTEVVLNPSNTVQQQVEPSQSYIQYVTCDGERYNPNGFFNTAGKLHSNPVVFQLSAAVAELVTSASVRLYAGGNYNNVAGDTIQGNVDQVSCTFTNVPESSTSRVVQFTLTLSTGTELSISFDTGEMG